MALVTNGLGRGGAETQLLRVAQILRERGDEVGIVSILPIVEYAEVAELGIPVATIGVGSLARGAQVVASGTRILRDWVPDTLISFVYQANVLGRCAGRLAQVPTIVSSIRNEHFGGRGREATLRLTDRFATVTTTNSARAAASLIERRIVPSDRLVVVPNGLDTETYRRDRSLRAQTRAQLGVADHDFLWLAGGRLQEQKDHATLLKAVALVGEQRAIVAIAGDGPLRSHLEELATSLRIDPPIRFLGLRDDVAALLGAADALVLSSAWEGSPNIVLEAMAASLPVVATAVGGVTELVRTGYSGTVVPPRDADALAGAMRAMMALSSESRLAMGEVGHDAVEREHSIAAMRVAWLDVLGVHGAFESRHPSAGARLPINALLATR